MGKHIFDTRTIEADTRILAGNYLNHKGYDLFIELWSWDGIIGKSLIFVSDQIRDLGDVEVSRLAEEVISTFAQLPEDHSSNLSRDGEFVFYNFDFSTGDD